MFFLKGNTFFCVKLLVIQTIVENHLKDKYGL